MKRRVGKLLLLLTLSGPVVITSSCGSLLLGQARDVALGVTAALMEALALELLQQIGLGDTVTAAP